MVLTLTVDSIHQVNCLRDKGYLRVAANGGVPNYTYNWSNGNTGPLATDLVPGVYNITVTDNTGATATVSATISEDFTLPEAFAGEDFTVTCANSLTTLVGTGSTGADFRYLWTATNGGVIQSGATTLSPVIRHVGTFTLKVTNIVNGCTQTSAVVVSATHQPPVITATGGTINCSIPSVQLNNTYPVQNTTYIWNGPNGYVSQLLYPQVATAGTYVFKVTDTLTTCISTANAIVVADTAKPVALPVGGLINCAQPTMVITGTYTPVNATFFWMGPAGFVSTLQTPEVSIAGSYRVTVTNPVNTCTTTASALVAGNFTPPTAFASVNGFLNCIVNSVPLTGNGQPTGITYAWTGPLGFTSNQQNPSVSNAGLYVLTTRNPQNGCTATATVTVMSNTTAPGATATGGVKTCANPNVTLTANSPTQGVSYKWSGPSNFMSTVQNPVVSFVGAYIVTVTSAVNGCTSTAAASVTQNLAAPNVNATSATVTCYVPNPHVNATSTTPGATFSWVGPNGYSANIANPTVSVQGTYTVTAMSPVNGCTASKTIFVDEYLAMPIVYAGEDRTLNCTFTSILANPINTSTGSNFSYLWTTWDGHIFDGADMLYARFDAIGHYTLTVTHLLSGCVKRDSMEVRESLPFEVVAQQLSAVSCHGGANGSVRVTADGGASPYFYMWSNGSQTATVNNLSAAVYEVTTSDSEGCTAVASVVVTQPSALVATVTATAQTLVGVNNGSATANPSGGIAPYTILWSNGGVTPTILNLAPGSYTVTITDSKGCTKSNTANVNGINCAVSGNISAANLSCANAATGSATATVTGVAGPITYTWSNGAQTQTASNLAAGNYAVTATGANGCSTVLSTQITGPQPLVLSVISSTNVSCASLFDGTVSVNAMGGTAPYSYAWSSSSTAAAVTGLGAGTYTCTATDANGCTVVQNAQIIEPQQVALSLLAKTDVPCVDGQTGSITVNATGGTAPFNYIWSNNSNGATITNLVVGNYQCTVTDAMGCSKNLSAQIIATDNTPPQLILKNASVALGASGSASVTPAMFDNGSLDQSCGIVSWTVQPTTFDCSQLGSNTVTLMATDKNGNTATGMALLTVIDDVAPVLTCPPNQSASACASTVFFNPPQLTDNCIINGGPTLVSGLTSGASFPVGVTNQQYAYTDAGGNMATCQFTVTVASTANVETSVQPTGCSGDCTGSVTLTVLNGGTPSSVIWSDGQTGLSAINLCPGSYFATLTDAVGCSQTYVAQVSVLDSQAPVLTCPNDIVTGYCNPIVTFSDPQVADNCTVNLQQLQRISGLPSGTSFPIGVTTETYRFTDGGGNVGECSFNVTVHLAASVNSSATNTTCYNVCDGTGAITVSGGQGPFGILWSNGAAGPAIGNLCSGAYMATVSDFNGCSQVQTIQIQQASAIELLSSNVSHDIGNAGIGSITINMSGGVAPYTYAWTKDGQTFSGNQNLSGLFAGDYVVMVTDARGCLFTSAAFTINSLVGTSTPDDQFQWEMFPNPARSEVYLKVQGSLGLDTQINVYDVSGRLVLEQSWKPVDGDLLRLDLSGLPTGMLLIRLITGEGSASKVLVHVE